MSYQKITSRSSGMDQPAWQRMGRLTRTATLVPAKIPLSPTLQKEIGHVCCLKELNPDTK